MVLDIYRKPSNPNEIFIGVENGGLWRTLNGGLFWSCVTDNFLPAGAGVTSIAKNPFLGPSDLNEMYIGTTITGRDSRDLIVGWPYGQGIWKSINGGSSWTVEPTFSSYEDISEIQYCPFKVNIGASSEPMLLAASEDKLLQKIGYSGAWTNIPLPPALGILDIRDITFIDGVGKAYVSTENGWNGITNTFLPARIYEVNFNPTTGVIGPINILKESTNGGLGFTFAHPLNNTTVDCISLGFETAYAGNNKLYMITCGADIIPGITALNPPCADINQGIYTLYSYNIATNVWTLEFPMEFEPANFNIRFFGLTVSPSSPDVIYLYAGVPYRLYKDQQGVWHRDQLAPYTGTSNFHPDPRCARIVNSVVTPANPGSQDIVLWGNDGGMSQMTGNTILSLTSSANNTYGDGFWTSEVYDVDVSNAGKKRTAGSYHNGLYGTTNTNLWNLQAWGDGFDAVYDKRFPHQDQRLLYHDNSNVRWKAYNHLATGITGGTFTYTNIDKPFLPNGYDTWRDFLFPSAYDDQEHLYMGNKNMLRSQPMDYGGWSVVTNTGDLAPPTSKNDNCRAIAVAPSNTARKYYGKRRPFDPTYPWNLLPEVFYALDNNGLWKDVTPPLIASGDFNFTDVVVDSEDEDRVWVSMGGIDWGPGPIYKRVYYGEFDPNIPIMNWQDMSNGLPELPVTCMVYQEGSDDIIYAGTDAGVYRWDKPQGCWVKFNTSSSGDPMGNVVVHDLEIDYCNRKLVMGSYGRGIWETDLYEPSVIPGNTDEINTNTTWGNTTGITTKYIKGSVLVKAPATLTILGTPSMSSNTSTTTIYMPKYGEIRVEQGAKLVVNGAHITNDCIKNWHGIYAYGNGSQPQIITGGLDPNHGIVDMTDAIIENAEDAVNNFGGSSTPNTGGILKATRTKFLNNIRSVAMLKYNNVISGVLQPDLSLFQFCTFEVNNAIKDPFLRHVTLWGVRGVSFEQNNFLNNTGSNVHHREAVYTIDASYTMNSNTFDGFYKGIESSQFSYSTGNLLPIHIGDNEFNANEIAIHLKAMNYPLVRGNTINIGMKQTPIDPGQTAYFSLGAKMESVSRFLYTKNYHNMSYQPVGGLFQYTAGTEVYNTGDNEENINENYYNDLLIGNDAAFQCANAAGSAGLNYKCNVNTDNLKYDFIIQGTTPRVRNVQWGGVVGGQIRPTGNVLSQNASVASWHHVLGGNAPVTYLYNIQFPNEFLNGNSSNVSPQGMASSAFCAMSFAVSDELNTMLENSEYNLVSPTQLDTIKNLYELANTEYTQLNTLYNQLLDNGNTDSLVEEIQNFTVAEQLETREKFLAMSPYVTTESLRELAEQGTVSNPILFEILLANPEGSQNEDLINYIMLEKSNPLPLYMINLIRLSWQGTSARKELFNSISSASSIRSMLANQIVNIYQLSSTLANQDSFAVWIGRDLTLRNSYTFIDYLLYKGNRSEASAKLNALPLQFPFSMQDSIEYTAFTALYNFKKGLLDDTLEINQLDSVRLQTLVAIANSSDYSMARTMAQSALCFFYNICYPEPERELPQVASRPIGKLQSSPENNLITAYPNPSQDFIAFQYNLPIGAEAIRLDIVDAVGRNVYNTVLKGHVGQHIWDVRQMKDGIYIYNVTTKSGEKYSGKVTVKK